LGVCFLFGEAELLARLIGLYLPLVKSARELPP
jgi:hypothetical protein